MAEKKTRKYSLSEQQRKNALNISLGMALIQAFTVATLFFSGQNPALSPILAIISVNFLSALFAAWLSREGRAGLGIQILLGAQIVTVLLVILQVGGVGVPIALFLITLTFSVASVTLPQKLAVRYNIAAGVVALLAVLLDIFEPFERADSGGNAVLSWGIAGGLAVIFGFFILRQFRGYALRTKLIVAFLFIGIVTVVSFLAVANLSMRGALTQAAEQQIVKGAVLAGSSVDDYLRYNISVLYTAAAFPSVRAVTTPSDDGHASGNVENNTRDLLFAIAGRDPMILSIAVLDANGINLLDSYVDNVGKDESEFPYFRPAFEDQLRYVSPVLYLPEQAPSFFVSVPIQSVSGNTTGVLRAQYKASALQSLIAERGRLAGEASFSVLVDEDGILLAHGALPELIGHLLVAPDAAKLDELRAAYRLPPDIPDDQISINLPEVARGMENAARNAIFVIQDTPLGIPLTGAGATLKTTPWVTAAIQPQTVFLAPLQETSRNLMLVALALIGAAGVLGLGVAQVIGAPIARLTEVANRFAEGELTARAQVESEDEIGTLATTFNNMAAQLRDILNTLEQRVAERTRALETSTEVSRRLSTLLDQDALVREVVNQVQSAFDYYHVHIYLLDDEQGILVMAGGTGEAGQIMLERGHQIPKGEGLVGRAAGTNLPVWVPDVSKEENWLPNPLLPETRAEAAIPIAVGDEVLGVLDVQESTVNGLTEEDVTLLQSIANQVAIALQNAESYRQTQQRANREAMMAQIAQQIRSTTDIEGALKITVRELGRALGTAVSVKLQPVHQAMDEKSAPE